MEYFDRVISSLIQSFGDIPPTFPYFYLIPSVILSILQSQKNHINYVSKNHCLEEYDYVVIGAGSGGSVMASRLSEDITKTVLLLEAGLAENVVSDIPRYALILQKTPIDWAFKTIPQNKACLGLKDRRSLWPRGKVMGGSSTINTMAYCRGNPRDYDNWADNGAVGWSWADIFPYFIIAEDNHDPDLVKSGFHGVGGPLVVTNEGYKEKVSTAFYQSAPYLGYANGDVNGLKQSVFTYPQRTILNGERLSVANAYLQRRVKNRSNIQILIGAFVTKIIFDENKRAVGVEFIKDFKTRRVKVNKEVILSAGTVMSPKILMLSGIGPTQHLQSLGIPVVSDLPVGDNLQEHVDCSMMFTLNESVSADFIREITPWYILEYYAARNNALSSSILEAYSFVKTKYANQSASYDWPDIQLVALPGSYAFDYGFRLKTITGMSEELWQTFEPYVGLSSFMILPILLRPKTRGRIRLQTANPMDPPLINPNFFAEEYDLNVLVEGMKIALAVGQTPPLQRYGATPITTVYPGCEMHDIYSEPYLRCMCQTFTTHLYHPMGTCKMGAITDTTAVVDPYLRVKGVTGLRVVDASIIPFAISGNINAPTVAIAEKGADLVKGRRLKKMVPPMPQSIIDILPNLPYDN